MQLQRQALPINWQLSRQPIDRFYHAPSIGGRLSHNPILFLGLSWPYVYRQKDKVIDNQNVNHPFKVV
jgi:hypothetical protein